MIVAVVGGTGTFGRALVGRLAAAGVDVTIGSRDAERASELGAVYGVEGGANADVVRTADFAVLAVPSRAALETARGLAAALGETPLLSVASDLRFTPDGVLPGRLGRSLAEEIAEVVRGPVVAGFQSLAAAHLVASEPPVEDAFVCGDDREVKAHALELGAKLVRGRAIDAGPLANARGLEAMTAVLLSVNKRYRTHTGIRLTGLAD